MEINHQKTETALVPIYTEIATFVGSVIEKVTEIEEEFKPIVPDASTANGYKFCKVVRSEVLPIKTSLEGARKKLKEPILKVGKDLDEAFNPLIKRLEAVYKPFETEYRAKDKEKERKKEERAKKVQEAIEYFNDCGFKAIGATSAKITEIIDELYDFNFDPKVYGDKARDLADRHKNLIDNLGVMMVNTRTAEQAKEQQPEPQVQQAQAQRPKPSGDKQGVDHNTLVEQDIVDKLECTGISINQAWHIIQLARNGEAGNLHIRY